MTKRPAATVVVLAAVVAAVLVLWDGRSFSAFSGSITNNSNSVRSALWTCQAAESADAPVRMYSLASTGGGTNQGSAGAGTNATFIGSVLGSGFQTGGGCLRDPLSYYTASPGLLGLAARWVSTAGTTGLTGTSIVSQEVWFQTSVKGGQLVGFGDSDGGLLGTSTSSNTALQVFVTDTGRLDFATGSGAAKDELLTSAGTNYADGGWHQVVAVYNGGTKQLYVDGQLRSSDTATGQALAAAYWRIGYDTLAGWQQKSAGNYFQGGVQWAALYRSALSAAAVSAHYRAGAALSAG